MRAVSVGRRACRMSVKVDWVVSLCGFVVLGGSREEKEFDQTRCPSFESPQAKGLSSRDVEENRERKQ